MPLINPPIITYSIAPINPPPSNSKAAHTMPRRGEALRIRIKRYTMEEITEVKNQEKKEILPLSPNLAPTITAPNGGTITARNDNNTNKSNAAIRVIATIKVLPGVFIIGENREAIIKKISLSGNGDIKIETTRKTAFNPM